MCIMYLNIFLFYPTQNTYIDDNIYTCTQAHMCIPPAPKKSLKPRKQKKVS